MKYLRITMPDNSRWDVPCEVIARNRAEYYAEKGNSFEREFEFAMNDDYELKDWAAGNMNWDDVKGVARLAPGIKQEKVDYQEGWVNGEKEIVDH